MKCLILVKFTKEKEKDPWLQKNSNQECMKYETLDVAITSNKVFWDSFTKKISMKVQNEQVQNKVPKGDDDG